jgi:hypothetical protein
MTTAQTKRNPRNTVLKITLFTTLLFLAGFLLRNHLNTQFVLAQNGQGFTSLTAIPPRLGDDGSILVDPGERVQVQVRLRNDSDSALDIITYARDFIVDADGETPIEIESSVSNRWSLASWLTLAPTQHSMNPGDTVGINVLIDVPEDALPGGHYAMILHQPGTIGLDGEIELDESVAAVSQRVGSLLYVIVDGPINEEAYVRNFDFPPFSEYGPVPFSFTVENQSDIHITPQVNVEIFNMFGQRVDDILIESKNIFPLTSRDFESKWNQIWGFGKYDARLTMSFGSQGSVVIANASFWLLPITLLVAILVGILIIIILIISVRRHTQYRRKIEHKQISELEGKIQQLQNDAGHDLNQEDNSQQHNETPSA